MKAYIAAVEIIVYDYNEPWMQGKLRVTPDGEATASVGREMRPGTERLFRQAALDGGLVEWREVGPPEGRDSVLRATDALLSQITWPTLALELPTAAKQT